MKENQSLKHLKQKITRCLRQTSPFGASLGQIIDGIRHTSLKILIDCISSSDTTMTKIKYLVLLHNLILYDSRPKQQLYVKCLEKCVVSQNSKLSFQLMLNEKLIEPYKMYIYKRSCGQITVDKVEYEIYALINLLMFGTSFSDTIFTLGRYIFKENRCVRDFNVVMAKDFAKLYKRLSSVLYKEIAVENVTVLQKINEKLYSVFYNCYFCKYVFELAPTWISIQNLYDSPEKYKSKRKIEEISNVCIGSGKVLDDNIIMEYEQEDTVYSLEDIYDFQKQEKENLHIPSISTIESANEKTMQVSVRERLQFIAFAEKMLSGCTIDEEAIQEQE